MSPAAWYPGGSNTLAFWARWRLVDGYLRFAVVTCEDRRSGELQVRRTERDGFNMEWDEERAKALVGKRVVVGFNHATLQGELIEKRARAGTIVGVHPEDGIIVRDSTGQEFQLPPALHGLRPGKPGTYTLSSSGKKIEDPDFEMIWTIWGFGTPDAWWELVTRSKNDAG
jgi:hypothetical protein